MRMRDLDGSRKFNFLLAWRPAQPGRGNGATVLQGLRSPRQAVPVIYRGFEGPSAFQNDAPAEIGEDVGHPNRLDNAACQPAQQ